QGLRPSAARRLEPALAPQVRVALEAPDDHAVDPRALADALAATLDGAVRGGTAVAGMAVEGERVTGVRLAGGEERSAGAVVIAAGAWSAGVAEAAVRPVK